MTEYEKRAKDPCWQHKQECVAMFTLDSHNTSYLYRREDNTYYWQHCRKEAEDDIFIDADDFTIRIVWESTLIEGIYNEVDSVSINYSNTIH